MNTAKKIYLSLCIIAAVAAGIGIYNLSNRSVEQKVYLNASWAMYYENIPALVEESDVIALVKVTGINKQYSMSGAPMIDFDADVVDLIHSKNQEDHLVVTQTGGIIENVTYEIADDPLMEIGSEYLIFGRVNSMGTVTILGGPQGRFVYDDGVLNSLFAVNQNTRGVDDGSNFLSPELDFRNADMDAVLAEINECIEEGEVGGEPELEHLTPAFFDVDKKNDLEGKLGVTNGEIIELCLNLSGCKSQPENIIYFAPNQFEKCCSFEDDFLLNNDNKIMILNSDLSNISSYLSSNTQEAYLEPDEYCVGMHYYNNQIYTATLSMVPFGTKLEIDTYDKNFSDKKILLEVKHYDINHTVLIDDQYCYYTARESSMGGNGISIFRIKLQENAVPELLWEDGGYAEKIYMDAFHIYDNLLIFTIHYGFDDKLNVYDIQNDSWIIRDNLEMAYAAYASGKLVYRTPRSSTINIYDLQIGEIVCSFDFNLYNPICVSCDEDYIYIDGSMVFEPERVAKIWIYDFQGVLVDTLDLENVITYHDEYENTYYSVYMCSTKELLFIGKQVSPYTNAIYIMEKSQIGNNEDKKIYALTGTF